MLLLLREGTPYGQAAHMELECALLCLLIAVTDAL